MNVLLIAVLAIGLSGATAQRSAIACREIDHQNSSAFKVGNEVWFGVISSMAEMGATGIITSIDTEIGIISVQPDGDPVADEIARRVADETFDAERRRRYPSPALRALIASHNPLCVAKLRRGQQLGFEISRNNLKHLK